LILCKILSKETISSCPFRLVTFISFSSGGCINDVVVIGEVIQILFVYTILWKIYLCCLSDNKKYTGHIGGYEHEVRMHAYARICPYIFYFYGIFMLLLHPIKLRIITGIIEWSGCCHIMWITPLTNRWHRPQFIWVCVVSVHSSTILVVIFPVFQIVILS